MTEIVLRNHSVSLTALGSVNCLHVLVNYPVRNALCLSVYFTTFGPRACLR